MRTFITFSGAARAATAAAPVFQRFFDEFEGGGAALAESVLPEVCCVLSVSSKYISEKLIIRNNYLASRDCLLIWPERALFKCARAVQNERIGVIESLPALATKQIKHVGVAGTLLMDIEISLNSLMV